MVCNYIVKFIYFSLALTQIITIPIPSPFFNVNFDINSRLDYAQK